MKSGRICSQCGCLMPIEAKFCAIDGTAFDAQATTSTYASIETQLRCPTCSRFYPQRAQFCASDGTPLTAPAGLIAQTAERSTQRSTGVAAQPIHAANQSTEQGDADSELIGTIIDGRYRIEALIAEGGMAVLYRAHQLGMDRTVAIKVMFPIIGPSSQSTERFAQECKLAAKLNHPNIVSVFDVGIVGPKQPYLVMEYIDGVSLRRQLTDKGPPPIDTAISIISQVLKGLEEAHAAGIIHRDLKPDNIILKQQSKRPDWVKIVDFGIANLSDNSKRFTKTGSFIGTPVYMAPEQFKGKPLDTRVDLYSLGIVLFEVLTGDVPFNAETPDLIMMQHLVDEPIDASKLRADVPQSLDAVVKKALAKERDERFQNAVEFRQALEACLETG